MDDVTRRSDVFQFSELRKGLSMGAGYGEGDPLSWRRAACTRSLL